MTDEKITEYIRGRESVTIPALQKEFSLSYGNAKAVVSELVQDGVLKFSQGITYTRAAKREEADAGGEALRRREYRRGLGYLPEDLDKLTSTDRRVLWECIQRRNVTMGSLSTALRMGTSDAYEAITKLQGLGMITHGFFKISNVTREVFLQKFGEPSDDEDDEEEDEDFGENDDAEDDDVPSPPVEGRKGPATSFNEFYEVYKLKTAFCGCFDGTIKREASGDKSCCYFMAGGRKFKLAFEDDTLVISDFGEAFAACKDETAGLEVLKDYPALTYEAGEIKARIEDRAESVSALLGLHAAAERIKRL